MRTQQLLRLVLPFAAAFSTVQASEQLVFREGGNVEGKEAFEMASNERPSLGDLLTVDRSLSIFYDYLRQSSSLSARLVNPLLSTSIFAPSDSVIESLARKPHAGPEPADYAQEYSVEDEKARAAYLERWVQSHIVDGSDLKLHDGLEVETLAGEDRKISFVSKDAQSQDGDQEWKTVLLQPGNVKILAKKEARDGDLYILDGILAWIRV